MHDIIEQLLAYLRDIWRNRWYVMVCAWLVCLVGWAVVLVLPNQYEATARVYVDTQTILRPLLQGLTVDLNPSAQVELITRTLFSRPNLENIAKLTGLDKQAKDIESLEKLLTRLKERVDFSKSGNDLYTIGYTDADPQFAKNMVQTVVDVFENNLVGNTQQGADTAQRFLDEQISQYELRLAEAENRLKEFKIKNAGRMPSEGQNFYARMQQIASDLEAARLELAQSENRRNALQQQVSGSLQQQQVKGESEKNITLPIDNRIQGLERKLDELLIQYTDKHPDVNILRNTIIDLKKQREQEYAQYISGLSEVNTNIGRKGLVNYSFVDELKVKLAEEQANLASLQVRVDEYKKRYNDLQGKVNIIPQVEAELSALNRDYDINRKKYDDLISRRESLRLSEQAEQSKQSVRYKIIDPPRVPPKPTGPKRLLLMSLVLLGGVGMGLGVALLIGQFWPVLDNRRSLKQIADIPIFGSVSTVLSPVALGRERIMKIAYAGLGCVLIIIYAGLVILEHAGLLQIRWSG